MDRRREQRVAAAFPVRVWGIDAYDRAFTQLASARNVSSDGARLEGMRCRLRPGDTVELQYAGRKAEFRVMWMAESFDGQEVQIGVKSLPSEDCIWDLNLERCMEFVGNG
jgi:hypothetical protein